MFCAVEINISLQVLYKGVGKTTIVVLTARFSRFALRKWGAKNRHGAAIPQIQSSYLSMRK